MCTVTRKKTGLAINPERSPDFILPLIVEFQEKRRLCLCKFMRKEMKKALRTVSASVICVNYR